VDVVLEPLRLELVDVVAPQGRVVVHADDVDVVV
jgi:hypothetical protein